ncbi:Nudix hydrolase 19, chloroplastic [Linum perenne]
MLLPFFSSFSPSFAVISFLPTLASSPLTSAITRAFSSNCITMSVNLKTHAFAGNPLRSGDPFPPSSALETLKSRLLESNDSTNQLLSPSFQVLPFRKGRPLASSSNEEVGGGDSVPIWNLGWVGLADCRGFLAKSGVELTAENLVYLGFTKEEDVIYWAIDVSSKDSLVTEFSEKRFCFVELRTLMVAADWTDERAMADLAIAGHARALLEWHKKSRFCGSCGSNTNPIEGGRRKQCLNEICKSRVYPRIDPVVIMLVIDKENDRVLLSRQSRFVPRMWSCLAGFIEPGESLEEAVRRETFEEAGIEVGEVVYHSSQPWPVGPSSMPCQLMVGFFAYAKTLEINVDKTELEDAKWHSREDVRKALSVAEYMKAQKTAAAKVEQMCKGVEKGQSLSADFNVESGELAPMFFPGPSAIAHHLISSWVIGQSTVGVVLPGKQIGSSLSNL